LNDPVPLIASPFPLSVSLLLDIFTRATIPKMIAAIPRTNPIMGIRKNNPQWKNLPWEVEGMSEYLLYRMLIEN